MRFGSFLFLVCGRQVHVIRLFDILISFCFTLEYIVDFLGEYVDYRCICMQVVVGRIIQIYLLNTFSENAAYASPLVLTARAWYWPTSVSRQFEMVSR